MVIPPWEISGRSPSKRVPSVARFRCFRFQRSDQKRGDGASATATFLTEEALPAPHHESPESIRRDLSLPPANSSTSSAGPPSTETEDDEPGHLRFFGQAGLAHETARTLQATGDLDTAQRGFERGVRLRAAEFSRTRAVPLIPWLVAPARLRPLRGFRGGARTAVGGVGRRSCLPTPPTRIQDVMMTVGRPRRRRSSSRCAMRRRPCAEAAGTEVRAGGASTSPTATTMGIRVSNMDPVVSSVPPLAHGRGRIPFTGMASASQASYSVIDSAIPSTISTEARMTVPFARVASNSSKSHLTSPVSGS